MEATIPSSDQPARFVARSAETWRDPFGMYRALRDDDPVHHVADGDFWVLSRFGHVFDAAPRPRHLLIGAGPHHHLRRTGRGSASMWPLRS
jgi:cytochrome P450